MAQLILTGFMGTGKTEVGRRLARATSRAFVDTDNLVEVAEGRSVAEIFATEGEARFRALERDAVRQAVAVPDASHRGQFLFDFTPQAEEALRRFADAGMHVVDSTTPLPDWPDIRL